MSKIGAVILAAGMSKRMGKPKLLLTLKGMPLIYYSISLAVQQKLNPIVVIAGKHMKKVEKVIVDYNNVTYILNPEYESGMASSLKIGIEAVKGQVDAVMVFLGDQPFVPNEVVQTLITEYEHNKDKGVRIVRPRYGGELGHPILFDGSLLEHFNNIKGDEGGRSIINNHKEYLKIIDFSEIYWGMDVDTPEDYERARKYR